MSYRRTIIAAAVTVIATSVATTTLYAQDPVRDTATVAEVVNGTTFKTTDGRRIVLLGIRFPRTLAITEADAKKHLDELIGGRRVILVRDTTLDALGDSKDERFVFADGMMVNVRMLKDGYAGLTRTSEHAAREQFTVASAEARALERGVWGRERARPVRCSHVNAMGEHCRETTRNLSGRCIGHE